MRYQMKSTEILEQPFSPNEYYSIIIAELGNDTKLCDAIQAKVYKYDDKGKLETSPKGTPFTRYTTNKDYQKDIRNNPISGLSTPLEIYNDLTDQQKEITNAIKSMCNNQPMAFFWHNGNVDDNCQYHGLHIHIIIRCGYKLAEMPKYRTLNMVTKKYGFLFKYQKVKYIDAILAHMQKPPRILVGSNNLVLCSRLLKTNLTPNPETNQVQVEVDISEENTVEEVEPDKETPHFMTEMLGTMVKQPTKTQLTSNTVKDMIQTMARTEDQMIHEDLTTTTTFRTKLIERVQQIKAHIKKWNKYTTKDILKEIYKANDMEALDEWRSLTTSQYFGKIWTQALDEISIEEELSGYTYITKYLKECPALNDTMNISETADTYMRWCKEQGIDAGKLALEIYAVLNKTFPKVNTLGLMGASNAGKTYWATSFMPFDEEVGQTVISTDFAFQKCLGKRVIHIPELTLTKHEQIEEAKKIFEGQATTINIKNREPQMMKRTPVILTSNQTPWRQFSGEDKAFKNRMFLHQNLKASDVLTTAGSPDTRFWQHIFEHIDKKMWHHQIPELEDELEWESDGLVLECKIKELSNQYSRTLEDTWQMAMPRILETRRRFDIQDEPMPEDKQGKINWLKKYLNNVFDNTADDYYWWLNNEAEPIMMVHGKVYSADQEMLQQTRDTIKDNVARLEWILAFLVNWPTVPIYTNLNSNLPALYKNIINSMFCKLFEVHTQQQKKMHLNDDTLMILSQHIANNSWQPSATSTPRKRQRDALTTPTAPMRKATRLRLQRKMGTDTPKMELPSPIRKRKAVDCEGDHGPRKTSKQLNTEHMEVQSDVIEINSSMETEPPTPEKTIVKQEPITSKTSPEKTEDITDNYADRAYIMSDTGIKLRLELGQRYKEKLQNEGTSDEELMEYFLDPDYKNLMNEEEMEECSFFIKDNIMDYYQLIETNNLIYGPFLT